MGWKPLADIKPLIELKPLKQFHPVAQKHDFDDQQLKGVCEAMLKADEQTVKTVGEELQKFPKEAFGKDSYIPDLLPRLWSQYDKTVRYIYLRNITCADRISRITAHWWPSSP